MSICMPPSEHLLLLSSYTAVCCPVSFVCPPGSTLPACMHVAPCTKLKRKIILCPSLKYKFYIYISTYL